MKKKVLLNKMNIWYIIIYANINWMSHKKMHIYIYINLDIKVKKNKNVIYHLDIIYWNKILFC